MAGEWDGEVAWLSASLFWVLLFGRLLKLWIKITILNKLSNCFYSGSVPGKFCNFVIWRKYKILQLSVIFGFICTHLYLQTVTNWYTARVTFCIGTPVVLVQSPGFSHLLSIRGFKWSFALKDILCYLIYTFFLSFVLCKFCANEKKASKQIFRNPWFYWWEQQDSNLWPSACKAETKPG